MKNIKLSKAITLALAGTALSIGAVSNVSAKSMYNTYNQYPISGVATDAGTLSTDGWVWGKNTSYENHLLLKDNEINSSAPWVGTSDSAAPLNYQGSNQLNWAVTLNAGGSQEISQQNAFDTYGVYADIDSAGGAWVDVNEHGWAHNTDVGLLKSSITQEVTLTASTILNEFGNFGITVYEGMDTNTGTHSHHLAWNTADTGFTDIGDDNPWDTQGLTTIALSETVDSINGLSFTAEAGKIYSIFLGGSGGIGWNDAHDGYILNISTPSAVPIPAAAWLMGSGLMGLASFSRRKKQST